MSVQRSPPGLGTSGSGGGSQPNLSSLAQDDGPSRGDIFITQRKRKQPDTDSEYKEELNSFKTEIMSFFKEFAKSQKDNTSQIIQDLSEIKEEIKSLKTTTNTLSQKFHSLSKEVSTLKNESSATNYKIETLEKEIMQLKNYDSNKGQNNTNEYGQSQLQSQKSPVAYNQDLLLEFQDRVERLKNIILEGIPEINEADRAARQQHDLEKTMDKLKSIYIDCPTPIKVIRLGKYKPAEQANGRLIKVCFSTSDPVRTLLRNRSKLSDSVRLFSDQTPSQKAYLKQLKTELDNRKQAGESDLVIKYVKDVPKIVKSKN